MDRFFGNSEMAKVVRSKDWSNTALGPIAQWPQGLKTTVSLCLNSNFPISLAWGPEHIQIYNDGYWTICGDKHPTAIGQNFKECWATAWPIIGEAFEQAIAGQAAYLTNQRMFLERFGYIEETFFTFSFSPIRGGSGEIEGLFHPVTEMTEKMLVERRSVILRNVSVTTSRAKTIDEAVRLTIDCLSQHNLDIPFALAYFYNESQENATLVASTGLKTHTEVLFSQIPRHQSQGKTWPIYQLSENTTTVLTDLEQRFKPIVCEPYPEPVKNAILLPITLAGQRRRHGVLICGVSARRALDEAYLTFYEQLNTNITTGVNNAHTYAQEKKRAEALAEIDRAKTTFFNNISHEFRTPLTLMLAPLESMLFENTVELPHQISRDLGMIYRNCIRLLKLVNNLLYFSRLESRQMDAYFEPVSLNELTEDIASSFLPAIKKAGLNFIVQCNPLNTSIYVDKGMWEKIVLNLLSNAFKYTLEGSITLTLKTIDDRVELGVHDTGVGIPDEDVQKIFQRFHRVKNVHGRTHEGTGIGLALVNELVKLHGGSIHVESRLKHGSAFIVSIPTGSKHLPAHQIRDHVLQNATSDHKYTKSFIEEALGLLCDSPTSDTANLKLATTNTLSKRIVLAEDNADMRQYITNLLSEEYQVLAFTNGQEALMSIIEKAPDLIISDVMMPVMDGLELIQHVRTNQEIANTPIILLSARAGQESVIAGIGSGADDYLVKPFSPKELLARIKQQFSMLHLRQESIKFKEEFLINVSHDLRSPLTSILAFTSIILSKKAGEISTTQERFLTHVMNSANHLLALSNDLLDIAKFEAGKIILYPVQCTLSSIAEEVIDTLNPIASEQNITIETKLDPAIDGVVQDPLRLKQILYNFLSNAIKFSSKDKLVFLNIRHDKDGMFRMDVQDHGLGIKPENMPLLFSKFAQFQSESTSKQRGTGLGLYITKQITEIQGGKISVKSTVGEGSTFSVVLPRNLNKFHNKEEEIV